MLLPGIGMLRQAIDLRQRRSHDIIHHTTEAPELFDIVKPSDCHYVVAVRQPSGHAALLHHKARSVGDDGLFKADFGTVSETCYHGRILPPALGECLLRRWRAIGILQAFHVSHHAGSESQPLYPAVKVHLQTRFVSFGSREDNAVFLGINLKDRADGGVQLGVQQNDLLAMSERLENNLGAELHRAGHVHNNVDAGGARQQEGVLRYYGPAGGNCLVHLALRRALDDVREPGVTENTESLLHVAGVDSAQAHAGNVVHELVREPLTHEAGTDHRHTNRLAALFKRPQSIVHDDHSSLLR